MSESTTPDPTAADDTREALIDMVHREVYNFCGEPGDEDPDVLQDATNMADRFLASPWLAAHVDAAAAEARGEVDRLVRSRDNVLEAAKRDRRDLRTERNAARADRDALAQAIHDGRGILGFDNDGDTTPHTSNYLKYARFWVADATQERADRDEAAAEYDALEADRDRLVEAVRGICDEYSPDPSTNSAAAVCARFRELIAGTQTRGSDE